MSGGADADTSSEEGGIRLRLKGPLILVGVSARTAIDGDGWWRQARVFGIAFGLDKREVKEDGRLLALVLGEDVTVIVDGPPSDEGETCVNEGTYTVNAA
ncbi:hypothetical protein H0H87_001347 [Tephrocybe sp. NHM501043]|nr:hypothetical protein H0H87_011209 [Tephrocybe sp. NHM501043]KAG6851317.1 hypothetical protein H0H87_001347 [Tephrocybe sp. NHM501043]